MKTRYANVTLYRDRHGKLRARWRKTGFGDHHFRHLPDAPGFEDELEALLAGRKDPETSKRLIPFSVSDGLTRYYRSANFRRGGADDQKRRRGILESFRAEFGDDLVADFGFEHIEAILLTRKEKRVDDRGRIVGGPVAATSLKKQLNRFFKYMKKLGWIDANPVEDAENPGATKISGYHTWTEAEITRFKRRHPIGTKARLALEIILWTWQRRGDARLFGPKHIVRGKINFTAGKNASGHWLPIAPDLKRAIEAMAAVGMTTFLVTEYGKPFTAAGFGNWFRERCDEADLQHCAAHGLRKAGARRAAEAEGTQQGLKAVGGWKNDEEVSTYTAAVEQEGLAEITLARAIERFGDEP
ncbi:MAG TPA: tyrosine-type recombinase/integrase [Sphingomonas sp.]|nr:tyrosine-type recombinase/integrase [Sphingomonas sp.]